MRRLRFVHFADMHLDAPFIALRSKIKSERRRNDLLQVFDRILDIIKNEEPDIVLICGDLFEHKYVRKTTIAHINYRFSEIPSIPVVILPGNHDPYVINSYYQTYNWSSNVFIIKDDEIYHNKQLGVKVFGITNSENITKFIAGHNTSLAEQAVLDLVSTQNPEDLMHDEDISISMLHGSLDIEFTSSAYNPFSTGQLECLNMDYYALGHFHNMLYAKGDSERVYNPGSPEPLGFDEEGMHFIFSGEIQKCINEPSNLVVKKIPINMTQYKSIKMDISGCESMHKLLFRIIDALKTEDREQTLFRIILFGQTAPELAIDNKYIENTLLEQFFYVKIVDNTKNAWDIKKIAGEKGIRGAFAEIMLQKIANEEDDKKRHLLEKAFDYGLEALNGRKIEIVQGFGDIKDVNY